MRPIMRCFSVLLAVFTVGLCGCGKNSDKKTTKPASKSVEPPPSHVVAMVNATPLTWGEMDKRAMGYLKDDVDTNHLIIPSNRLDEAKEYFRRRSINAFVFKTVMLDEAVKQNVRLTDNDRQESLKNLAASLRARNWTTNDFFLKGPMGEAAMRREFDDGMIIDKLLKLKVRTALRLDDK